MLFVATGQDVKSQAARQLSKARVGWTRFGNRCTLGLPHSASFRHGTCSERASRKLWRAWVGIFVFATCFTNIQMIHGALRDGRRRAANAPSTKFSFICSRPTAWPSRAFTSSTAQGALASTSAKPGSSRSNETLKPGIKQGLPSGKITAHQKQSLQYGARLDALLPPHLRSHDDASEISASAFTPNATEMARLAHDADKHFNSFLEWVAIDQGRWRAAVWIVKLLVEHFHPKSPLSNRLAHTIQKWNLKGSLNDLVKSPLYLVPQPGEEPAMPHIQASSAPSLHELTDDKPESLTRSEIRRHNILGLVWRDIGRLIIVCATDPGIAGGEVKPDVLEMIALLHHYELMPESIYTYIPAESPDAIQQPPTLHLLSSRIFTALSDATWRAREMSALEEAKRKGGGAVGLETRGSSYRVRVSGIKPEIWLELILWSCLHGGWIADGTTLLRGIHRSKAERQVQWKPISWRDSLNAIAPSGPKDSLDWDGMKFMFDNRSSATMDGVDIAELRVDKTVSSEIVNAYIDALLTMVSTGVGARGISLNIVTRSVRFLREFLQRANLNLGGGSWDAMMIRLVESGSIDVDRNPYVVQELIGLSPRIGEELLSRRSQVIPAYVLDGSAAILGLLHRALYAEIKKSNLEGALRVFKLLQERVDDDRNQSLSDFFSHKYPFSTASGPAANGRSISDFSGIDYPSFSTQIPPATLAAFLELVTNNRYFDLGNWMLGIGNTDIDGPLIHSSLYSNPLISAAIVNHATATDNTKLLQDITKSGTLPAEEGNEYAPTIPRELLQAFFNTQIKLKRWDSAIKILEYMHDTPDFDWSIGNAARVAKAMILAKHQVSAPSDPLGPLADRAEDIFSCMLQGKYGRTQLEAPNSRSFARINTLCVILSSISPHFAARVRAIRPLPKHFNFTLGVTAFNDVLEAVAATQGSEAGRALVDRFAISTAPTVNKTNDAVEEVDFDENNDDESTAAAKQPNNIAAANHSPPPPPPSMPRFLRDAIEADKLPRANIPIPISSGQNSQQATIAMYGRFQRLGPTTVRIIVRQAVRERRELKSKSFAAAQDQSTSTGSGGATASLEIFSWALYTLRRTGHEKSVVWDELAESKVLTGEEMGRIKERAGEMWRRDRRQGKQI